MIEGETSIVFKTGSTPFEPPRTIYGGLVLEHYYVVNHTSSYTVYMREMRTPTWRLVGLVAVLGIVLAIFVGVVF